MRLERRARGEAREVSGQISTPANEGGRAPDELPSVALTQRFLVLCAEQGTLRFAVKLVAVGRSTGVPGLPASDDWTAWDADEMRAAADYLEQMRIR